MESTTLAVPKRPVYYPETDGLPMAENTRQYDAIVTVKENLEIDFADRPAFIAGDLFWYPVEGDNKLVNAPDVLVALGRPKGHRGSYRQWEEGGIAPQVVFEMLSPSNRLGEMARKFQFYERFGVEEYYVYHPEDGVWEGWLRRNGRLEEIANMHDWVSPLLGIRFESVYGSELTLFHPNGERFLTPFEMHQQRHEAVEHAELERRAREQAQQRADVERREREQAQQRAEQAQQRAEQAQQRADLERRAREQAQQDAECAKLEAEQHRSLIEQLTAQLRAAGIPPSVQ